MSEELEPRVAEGRAPGGMSLEDAIAIADANEATNFPPPPIVQAVLDAAKPAEIRSARAAMKARQAAAEAEAKAKAKAEAETSSTTAPGGVAENKE